MTHAITNDFLRISLMIEIYKIKIFTFLNRL